MVQKNILNTKCNKFWKDVFHAYVNFASHVTLKETQDILAEPIFGNDKFKIDNKTFCCRNWTDKNIFLVRDIVDDNGCFLSYTHFKEKYNINVNYLQYMGCIRSIKSYLAANNIQLNNRKSSEQTKALQIISSVNKGSRIYYNTLMESLFVYNINSFIKWEEKLNIAVNWETTLKQLRKIKEVKLKWFQIRLCYNILVTNSILKKMGIRNSDMCTFCHNEKESVQHYLWYCVFSQYFWRELETFLKENCETCLNVKFNIELVLFGNDDITFTDEIFVQIILLAKYFIYRCRIHEIKPSLQHFLKDLRNTYKVEKYMHSVEMTYSSFIKKWFPYKPIVEIDSVV